MLAIAEVTRKKSKRLSDPINIDLMYPPAWIPSVTGLRGRYGGGMKVGRSAWVGERGYTQLTLNYLCAYLANRSCLPHRVEVVSSLGQLARDGDISRHVLRMSSHPNNPLLAAVKTTDPTARLIRTTNVTALHPRVSGREGMRQNRIFWLFEKVPIHLQLFLVELRSRVYLTTMGAYRMHLWTNGIGSTIADAMESMTCRELFKDSTWQIWKRIFREWSCGLSRGMPFIELLVLDKDRYGTR